MSAALVSLEALASPGGSARAVTDRHAEAHFRSLAAGRYAYQVEAPALLRTEGRVALDAGERKRLVVRLGARGLSISGRVRDAHGAPLAGIGVSATRHRFVSTAAEGEGGPASTRAARSRADGTFVISDLAEGEYDVETAGTDLFAPERALAKAGTRGVELVLAPRLVFHGSVVDARGDPLRGVEVRARDETRAAEDVTSSDDSGAYLLATRGTLGTAQRVLRFSLTGYEPRDVPLTLGAGFGAHALDVALEPLADTTTVSGRVRTERGDAIEGATVVLGRGPGAARHQTRTGPDGSFSLPGVQVEASYRLDVLAGPRLRDHAEEQLWVAHEPPPIDVVVESLGSGRLRGRMLDAEGRPIPGFRLWLAPLDAVRAALPVTSDERGFFALEEAPAGPLVFDTRSAPRLQVSGLSLSEGDDQEVSLVLDWGRLELAGALLDERGSPVPGARVELAWTSHAGSGESTSSRAAVSDRDGRFAFSQLGPGAHLVSAHAHGRRPVEMRWDPARDPATIELRIPPLE